MFEEIGPAQRRAGALVDTNLLVLLVVGRYDPSKLVSFRATRKYNLRFYQTLELLVSIFSRLYTTPNIITEVDNLSRQTSRGEWQGVADSLRGAVSALHETPFASRDLVTGAMHPRLGITDCSIIEMASRGLLVITDDLALTVELERRRHPVVNLSRYFVV
jgi:hypothetical protein